MANVTEIIKLALKDAGVIGGRETPTDDEMQDSFTTLNQMISVWRTESLDVYCQKSIQLPATGAISYTVGPGGDINIERPVSVDAMFWRLNDVDTVMTPIHSFEDYQEITCKNITSTPTCFYYRPDFPLGQLFVWPVADSLDLFLTIRQPLPVYLTINDDIALPPEYEAPIRFNLASWMGPTFGVQVPLKIEALAQNTKRLLKRQNTQIKTMRMPAAVMMNSRFNIYSGQNQ